MTTHKYFEIINIKFLKISSNELINQIDFINYNKIENVIVNSFNQYNQKDIEFILKCPSIIRLFIVDDDINIDIIKKIENLEFLSTNSKPIQSIDFSNFKKLKYLAIDFAINLENINKVVSLEHLLINALKDEHFFTDSNLINLKFLELVNSKLTTVTGIHNLLKLEELELKNNSKLKTVVFTCEMAYLKRIYINNCKSLSNISGLEHLPNLEILVMSDCKCIESCNFLQSAKEKLSRVVIRGTKVLDDSFDLVKKFKEHKYEQGRIEISNF
jgi:hypothetical protein